MRVALVVCVLAAGALSLVLSSAPAATEQRCGVAGTGFAAPQDVRAIRVSCARARRLARNHSLNNGRNDDCDLAKRSCLLDGYTCRRTFFANSGTRVRCAKGTKKIRFFYGS